MSAPDYPDIGQARDTVRHCDRCGEDIVLSPLRPGWTPLNDPDLGWIWVCPACGRAEGLI